MNFTVKDISGPQVNLSTNAVEVIKGDAFDPRQYLVSAIDNKDGDVTGNVVIGNIDTGSTGDKAVTYTVSDSSGNQTVATLNVKVYTPGSKILETAYTKLGSPYVWGATGPNSFDCSGFTSYVYRVAAGREIGGWTVPQESAGTTISIDQAQPGDLLFWGSHGGTYHVAIALGGGQYVHAPAPGQTVTTSSYAYFAPSFAVRM